MSEKNFVAYGDAESILTGYANRIKQSPTTFVGTQAQWNALSSSQKAEYELVDITDDSLSPSGHVDWESNGKIGSKNLLPNKATTQTINGVTFTINFDGSVTANGTATSNAEIDIATNVPLNGNYILSDDFAGISGQYWAFANVDNGARQYILTSKEMPITISNKLDYFRVKVFSGVTANNITFKPMIRLATDSDSTYQPYAMTNQQITPYVQAISNPNLLDNPWFTVNQRGENSYLATTGIYTLDRWRLYNGQVDINSDGTITLSSTANNTQIQNRVDPLTSKMLDGRTVTLSAIVNGKIYSQTFTWKNSENYQSKVDIGNWVFDFRNIVNDGDSGHLVRFFATTQTSEILVVKAVKLELGSASTLAMDTAPNYVSELLKCQRYFVRFSAGAISTGLLSAYAYSAGAVRFSVPLPVKMRVFPTISYSNLNDWGISQDSVQNAVSPTSITLATRVEAIMVVDFASNSYIAQTPYVLCCKTAGAYIDFSADL